MTKLVYTDFNDFVRDFPDGESYREYITDEYRYSFKGKSPREKEALKRLPQTAKLYWIVKSYQTCLPHGYAIVKIVKMTDEWKVYINDGDDCCMENFFETEGEALDGVVELLELVPFKFSELKDFGYLVG